MSTKPSAKEEPMAQMQGIIQLEAQEWQQPRILTLKHMYAYLFKAIWALVLPVFKLRWAAKLPRVKPEYSSFSFFPMLHENESNKTYIIPD